MKAKRVPDGITDAEWEPIREARGERIKHAITAQWMEFGEYLRVEFDVDDYGNVSARVIPNRE